MEKGLVWGGSVALGRVDGRMRDGWNGRFDGQGGDVDRLWKRGRRRERVAHTYMCMTKEGEERNRMVEKRACRLKKERGADT